MRNSVLAASVLALTAGAANAGGIDRSRLSYGVLFEPGSYVELGITHVSPTVSGAYAPAFGGGSTGDMAGPFKGLSFAYKSDLNETLALGVFFNMPYSADANYSQGIYSGLRAEWTSHQIAAVLKYKATDAISVYGGLRYLRSSADINIPPALFGSVPGGYSAKGDNDEQFGYIVGAAYEKPDIALRVGLTYESGITHKFDTTETSLAFGAANPIRSVTEVEMPQSVTLDFQSGIAKDTLLFGSIRWAEWSVWKVAPAGYDGAVNPGTAGDDITSFDNDVLTWQLGVGRRLNENFSAFARASYEKSNGGDASRLAPTDGSTSFGIGGTYTKDNLKITAGIEYIKLGDAVSGPPTRTQFTNNDAIGIGISIGYRF
jgi:long-chain fatty acid transport protein